MTHLFLSKPDACAFLDKWVPVTRGGEVYTRELEAYIHGHYSLDGADGLLVSDDLHAFVVSNNDDRLVVEACLWNERQPDGRFRAVRRLVDWTRDRGVVLVPGKPLNELFGDAPRLFEE